MNEDTDHGFIKRICYDDDGKETGIPSEELASQDRRDKAISSSRRQDIPMQMGFDFN